LERSGAPVRRLDDPNLDEILRTLDRQRPEPDGVDELEDRGVRASAERERQDRDAGERPVLEQEPRAVPQVLAERFEEAERAHVLDSPSPLGRKRSWNSWAAVRVMLLPRCN